MTELIELTVEDVVVGSLNAIADLRRELNDLDDRKKQGVALILTPELQAELDALDKVTFHWKRSRRGNTSASRD